MQRSARHELRVDADETDDRRMADQELSFFKDVLKLLPAAVTVQDEHGRLLLVNDAAVRQFGMDGPAPVASELLGQRGESARELLHAGREAVAEECVGEGPAKQVFLTSHRPARIGGRDLLCRRPHDPDFLNVYGVVVGYLRGELAWSVRRRNDFDHELRSRFLRQSRECALEDRVVPRAEMQIRDVQDASSHRRSRLYSDRDGRRAVD